MALHEHFREYFQCCPVIRLALLDALSILSAIARTSVHEEIEQLITYPKLNIDAFVTLSSAEMFMIYCDDFERVDSMSDLGSQPVDQFRRFGRGSSIAPQLLIYRYKRRSHVIQECARCRLC